MSTSIQPPTDPKVTPEELHSLPRLLRTLVNDLASLVRQEFTLARTETRARIRGFAGHAGQVAAGGGVVLVGILVLVGFLVVGLGVLLDGAYWLSSLLVALVLLVIGGAMGYFGAKRIGSGGIAPTSTIETIADTKVWAEAEIRELRGTLLGEAPEGILQVGERPFRARSGPAGDGERTAGGRLQKGAFAGAGPTGQVAKAADAARPPLSIPIHKRVLREIAVDDVPGQAAKVAFYMFSSLPPALLVVFALTGILGGESVADIITSRLQGVLPGSPDDGSSAAGFVSGFVNDVVHDNAPGPLSIGLLLGLWASSAVFIAMAEALNRTFDVTENRSWLRKRALALGVMLGFALFFLGGSVALLAGPGIAGALGLEAVGSLVWSIAQWPLAFALIVAAFYMVYYVLPNRDQRGYGKALLQSSAIAAGLWLIATFGFRQYIENFGSYSATYGVVGAIMVLLLWMYITSAVILIGGEIGSEMTRQST